MKICTKCSTPKDEKQFSYRSRAKNTYCPWCKECVKLYDQTHFKNNHQKLSIQKNLRKMELRNWMHDLKSKLSCKQCPENDPACLTFHHTDPSIKDFTISNAVGQGLSKETILQEITKCIVLCSNCHLKFHFYN